MKLKDIVNLVESEEFDFEGKKKQLEQIFFKYFPNGWINVTKAALGKTSIAVGFGLIGSNGLPDKSKLPSAIMNNDPGHNTFVIHGDDNGNSFEFGTNLGIMVNPKEKYVAMSREKINVRKTVGDFDKILKTFDNALVKFKALVKLHKNEIYKSDSYGEKFFEGVELNETYILITPADININPIEGKVISGIKDENGNYDLGEPFVILTDDGEKLRIREPWNAEIEVIKEQFNHLNEVTVPKLHIKQIGRSFYVMSGVSKLGKFKTEQEARESLDKDRSLYDYWAGSAGVSIENTPPVIKKLKEQFDNPEIPFEVKIYQESDKWLVSIIKSGREVKKLVGNSFSEVVDQAHVWLKEFGKDVK